MKFSSGKSLQAALLRFSEDKEEYRKVLVLCLYLLFVSSASTVGRTAADALFLSRFDASLLSKMYLPQAAALILAGIVYQKYGHRIRMDRFLYWLIPSLALLVIISRIGVGMGQIWVLPVIYVAYDVFNFLMIVCFWQFATFILDQRKVKRTIGLVGSGGIVGGIISGFGLKLVVPWVGTENLIFFYAALQLLALAAVVTLIRLSGNPAVVFAMTSKATQTASPAKPKKRREKEQKGLSQAVPHLKYVAVMSSALILALTFVDYQFKVILQGELQNEALAGFMGSFYGMAGLLALLVQVFVAGKLLARFGVMTAILVFPVVLLTGSVGVLLFPVLAMAVLVKGSDKVVGDTINSSVNQLIMFPIPPQWRNQAKSFLDGIVRNGAKGLASIGLIVLSPLLSAQHFSYVVIGLLAVCIAAAIKVKGAYLKTLLATLQTSSAKLDDAELDLMDPASVQLLEGTLKSVDKQQALYAFRMLRAMDSFDLTPHIPGLLRHPSREVAIEVLQHIERTKLEGQEAELLASLDRHFRQEPAPIHLPKVFERIASPAAFDKLLEVYSSAGFEMKIKLLEALNRMIRVVKISEKQRAFAEGLVLQEISFYWSLNERLTGLSVLSRYGNVTEVCEQFRSTVLWRIFQLLALIYDAAAIRAVYANWTDGDARQQANAMEVVDQLAQGTIRLEVTKIMGASPSGMHTARSEDQIEEQLSWLNQQDDLWLRQVIRHAVSPDASEERKEHMDRIRHLRNVPLFQGLTSRELSEIAKRLGQIEVKRGEYIFKGTDSGNSLYMVRSGGVGIYRDGVKVADRRAGEAFGQSGILIEKENSADAAAEYDSLIWTLDSDEFYEVMFDRSSIAIEVMKVLSRRLRSVLSQQHAAHVVAGGQAELIMSKESETALAEVAANLPVAGNERPDSLLRRVLILQKIDFFSHLAEDDIVRLAQMVDEVEYDTGEVICQAGDYGDALFGIFEGTVRVHQGEDTLAYLREGDCFGEMAIIDSGPRSADCTATAPTVLLQLHKEQVFSLCFQNMDVLRSMIQVMGDRLKGMENRV